MSVDLQPSTGTNGMRSDKICARKGDIKILRRTKAKLKTVN